MMYRFYCDLHFCKIIMSYSPESGEVIVIVTSGCVFTDFKREGFIKR